MENWDSLTPQLILTVVSLVSTLVILLVTNLSVESNKPNLDIVIPPQFLLGSKEGHINFDLLNFLGKKPATNLLITLELTDNGIKDITIWSTENATLLKKESDSALIQVPRLAPGEGSIVSIDIELSTKSAITNYKVFASFDEGSKYLGSNEVWIATIFYYAVKLFFQASGFLLGLAIYCIVYIALAAYGVFVWPKKRIAKRFTMYALEDIISTRRILRNNEKYGAVIETDYEWNYFGDEYKRRILKTPAYIALDDLFAKISIRNSKIQNNEMTAGELVDTNRSIVKLADNAAKHLKVHKMSSFDRLLAYAILRLKIGKEKYIAKLESRNVVPPSNSIAKGTMEIHYIPDTNNKRLSYKMEIENVNDVTGVHINKARMGRVGDNIVLLGEGTSNLKGEIDSNKFVGELKGKGILDLIDLMTSGETYINVTTEKFPLGEIRGQIYKALIIFE